MMDSVKSEDRLDRAADSALRTITLERQALEALWSSFGASGLDLSFRSAVAVVVSSTGRIVVTGMGKSGLIARKIAATLASTGTPSFYIHPGDASHGDLGMITAHDVVLALSWSGETAELSDIITYCGRFGIPLIAVTSQPNSTLGLHADICLTLPNVQEACPNDLAPTASTTLQATIGDALAIAALEVRGFSANDFRILHPRGRLGAQLKTVGDLMSKGEALPKVSALATIAEATLEMSAKRFGITAVVHEGDRLIGAFSDGDLRRSLAGATLDACVQGYMTRDPVCVGLNQLASEALALMNSRKILQLFVCDQSRVVGVVHLHDILRAGVV